MPLGADVVQVAKQAAADHRDGVVVKDVVVPLMAGGQEEIGLGRHAGHLLALVDAVAHQLLGHHVQAGLHGGNCGGGVQMERQGDNHRLDAVLFRMGEQFLIGGVNLDVLFRFRVALPTVDAHQAGAGLVGLGAVVVAVECPPDVVGADVGDGLDGDELRIDGPQQHAPFVAGADHADAERLGQRGVVVEVQWPQAVARSGVALNRLVEQIAADELAARGGTEVLFSDRSVFGAKEHDDVAFNHDFPLVGGTPSGVSLL